MARTILRHRNDIESLMDSIKVHNISLESMASTQVPEGQKAAAKVLSQTIQTQVIDRMEARLSLEMMFDESIPDSRRKARYAGVDLALSGEAFLLQQDQGGLASRRGSSMSSKVLLSALAEIVRASSQCSDFWKGGRTSRGNGGDSGRNLQPGDERDRGL